MSRRPRFPPRGHFPTTSTIATHRTGSVEMDACERELLEGSGLVSRGSGGVRSELERIFGAQEVGAQEVGAQVSDAPVPPPLLSTPPTPPIPRPQPPGRPRATDRATLERMHTTLERLSESVRDIQDQLLKAPVPPAPPPLAPPPLAPPPLAPPPLTPHSQPATSTRRLLRFRGASARERERAVLQMRKKK